MTDAVKMAIEALRPFAEIVEDVKESASGLQNDRDDFFLTQIGGYKVADLFTDDFVRAAEALAALEQAGEPVAMIRAADGTVHPLVIPQEAPLPTLQRLGQEFDGEGEPVGLLEAVEGIDDDYMTSEKHHPGYVLIPTAKFEQIVAATERAKRIVPLYYVNWHHDADQALATPSQPDPQSREQAFDGEGEVPPMPETDDRGSFGCLPYSTTPLPYEESDRDWADRNNEAVAWLADNHAAIRAALSEAREAGDGGL